MDFVTFNENEKVNISTMDNQHKSMVKIINKTYTAFINQDNKTILSGLKSLLELLREHFEYEERMMKETNFPGYISHKLEHDRVLKKVVSFSDSYVKGKPTLTLEDLNNVKSWFHNHIELSDRKCGAHFVAKGIK